MDRPLAEEKISACGSARIQQVPAPVKAGKCNQQDFEKSLGRISVAGGKSVGPPPRTAAPLFLHTTAGICNAGIIVKEKFE